MIIHVYLNSFYHSIHRSSMKKKIAVLGSGPVAEAHLSILSGSKIFEPVVIFGRNKDRVSLLAPKYNITAAESLNEAMSGHNVSLIDISTSNDLHYPYALAALKAGKSVILEKPAAFRSADVETLVSEAKRRDLMILVCFQKRFNKSLKRVRSFLENGDSGGFLHGETRVFMPKKGSYFKSRWHSSVDSAGGGVLIYHAIHDLDLLCLLLGKVKSINGEMRNTYHSTEVEDTVHLVMEFESGGIHHFFASTDPRLPFQVETRLVFERGKLFFNDFGYKWSSDKEPFMQRKSYQGKSLMSRILFQLHGLGSYRNVLGDMEEFFSKKTIDLTSSLASAVEVHRVIDNFYSSTRR